MPKPPRARLAPAASSCPDGPVRSGARAGARASPSALRIEAGALTLAVDGLLDLDLVGLAQRAGREPGRLARAPTARTARPKTREGLFSYLDEQHHSPQHRSPHAARGVPPPARGRPRRVPARIRRAGPPRPLLVRRQRRPPRHARRGRSARRARRRLPRLRPRRSARADGAAAGRRPRPAGEPFRRRRHAPPVRPRPLGRRGARGRSRRGRGAARGSRAVAAGRSRPSRAATTRRFAEPGRLRARRRALQGAHPRGRRVPDRPLTARGAADRRLAALGLPLAAPRQPVAVSLPARARRLRAGRLVARDARQARRARGRR